MKWLALLLTVASAQAAAVIVPDPQCPAGLVASVHETVESLNWYGTMVAYCNNDVGCGPSFVTLRLEPAVNDFGYPSGEYTAFVIPTYLLDVADVDFNACTAHFIWTSLASPGDTIFRDTFGMSF